MKFKHILIFLLVMVLYFVTNRLNVGREVYDFGIFLDNLIPLVTWFVYFYLAYFILMLIPFFISNNTKSLTWRYCVSIIVSSLFFVIIPTSIYRPLLENVNLNNYLVNMIHYLDKPYNLFPSLHAALLTLSFMFLYKHDKKLSYKLSPLFILSFISTVFIKQHYVLDLIGGVLVALISIKIADKFEKVV